MARFNAAFMSGSIDEKFQNRYNYLLDLLDTGYIVEKMIGNSMSRIEVSPSVGIKISYGTTDMLSIDPTTGDLRVSGDIYVERLRASGSDDYMGFVKYGWGDTAVNFVTGDNDLPVQNMTEYLSITGDADTFTSSMLTMLDATPRLVSTEVKRNFATTLRVGVNQSLSAMDEENTAYLTVNGNAANPFISLTAVGATFATRSELKVEANNITFNGNKVWHAGNIGESFYQTDNSIDSNLTANNWPDGVKLMRVGTALNYPTNQGIVFSVKRSTHCFQLFASTGGAMHKRTTTMTNYNFSAWSAL